jgi:putative hydroxymethylpyrimidine transport system ATP-binding protein
MTAESKFDSDLPSAPGLFVRGASLTYDNQTVFENLDLDVPGGQVTCLLGPSGVGKSSLLRLIAGIAPEARARNVEADDGLPLPGRIAYMDQRDLLLPWLRVIDNVVLGSRLRRQVPDIARAEKMLRAVGLSEGWHKRPAELSGGMRQRVALARTLMEDRPVILMDEPFSAVDAITRMRLQDLAGSLLRGRSVLLVTHDPLEALRLGHRVLVMSGDPVSIGEVALPDFVPPRDPGSPLVQKAVGDLLSLLANGEVAA